MNAVVAREVQSAACARPVVHKFGGSSLASADAVRQAAAIVAEEDVAPCYVVVSAAQGVTDELLACLELAASAEDWRHPLERLHRRQSGFLRALLSESVAELLRQQLSEDFHRLKALLVSVEVLRTASSETVDAVLAHGELWSMRLFAATLTEQGLDATTLDARRFLRIQKEDNYVAVQWSQSALLFESARSDCDADVIVVPGFIGHCAERDITLTLGRNGSDWSATILARLVGAGSVTIWSDVLGVLDGDPTVVTGATTQSELNFDTAQALAAHGARILHPDTLAPLADSDANVFVKCTFEPANDATRLGRRLEIPSAMVSAHDQTVSVIGNGVHAPVALDALHHARIDVRRGEIVPDRLSVQVPVEDVERAQRVWHRRLCRRQSRLDVLLIGVGQVGGALLKTLSERTDESMHLVGVADSRHVLLSGEGIAPNRAHRLLGGAKTASDPDVFGEYLLAHCEAAPVIVDATGSDEIAARHAGWLAAGIHVVTANKVAAANGWVTPRQRAGAFYGDAATVGAGLPVLQALRRLRGAGDQIESVEGILSGSLAYLYSALERGRRFGAALASARRAGYVEPDPRNDLAGVDAARKLSIIAEAAGIPANIKAPEPAVAAALLEQDEAAFLETLPALEAELKSAVLEARSNKQVLRYVARLSADGGNHVGPSAVPRKAILAQTQGVENIVVIHSRAYQKEPLVIRGPGAGPLVTARALLADLATALDRYG